ncbi:hypothetical protein N7519_008526 [Penicillium mononematosum]|uniref:uncharacterized protein n=1 Tax=Penicillium mononematosum TaxID=268346 RepID=UPI0025483564|nr:uncharacterized protein N7519_008526 [Penicillium mononematosum]KAJ6178065.1 hypothetical protein N7519_008526 [Penicillium mononematosum]
MLITVFGFLHSLWFPPNGKPCSRASLESKCLDWVYDPKKISIIHRYESKPSVVLNYVLDDGQPDFKVLPGAPGYQYIGRSSELPPDDKRLKQLKKCTVSLEKLCQLLGSEVKDSHASSVVIGKGGFISTPHLEDMKKAMDMTDIYTKLEVRYSNGMTSTQYIHPRCFTIKQALLKEAGPVRFNRIEINSGICLFSKGVLSTSPGHGKSTDTGNQLEIPPLPKHNRLTIYELETITRMSSAIADTVGLIGAAYKSRDTPVQRVTSSDGGLSQSSMSRAGLKQSIGEKKQLGSIMTSVLRKMLMDRHICDVNIAISSGTEAAITLVREKMETESIASLEEILDALRSRGNDSEMWRLFLDNLDPRQQPTDMESLGRLIYVFKSTKPALAKQRVTSFEKPIEDVPNRMLIIQVDDVHEWKILDRAKSFIKEYSKMLPGGAHESVMLGLFPIQKIFSAGPGRSDLYLEDPGFKLRMSSGGRLVGPMDIISATYGEHIGNHVRRSCLLEGLS